MTTKTLRVLVLVSSTRQRARSRRRALADGRARASSEASGVELVPPVSIGDLDLPFLDEEEHPPSSGILRHEHSRRWSRMVDEADGFVVVTPEYNYGMPATLKNALDYLGPEWAWKPVGFVSYGHTSAGTRAVQHAKQVVSTLRLVPLGATVALRIAEVTGGNGLEP
ncbi:FMN reductase, partial [Streptomyces sp. SID7803]|nr:FMN reductase [Streptomyces sp. SID7803]